MFDPSEDDCVLVIPLLQSNFENPLNTKGQHKDVADLLR